MDGEKEIAEKDFCPPVPMAAITRLADGRLIGLSYDPKPPQVVEANLNGSTLSIWFSSDDGDTWQGPTALCSTPGCYYVHNGRILQLSTGRILIPANWVPSSCYGKDIETSDLSGAFYSDDNGATWQESNWIAAETPGDHLAESIAVELKDGTVKCFMRSTSGYMRQAISKDGGVTWEKEYATQLQGALLALCRGKRPLYRKLLRRVDQFVSRSRLSVSPLSAGPGRKHRRNWKHGRFRRNWKTILPAATAIP